MKRKIVHAVGWALIVVGIVLWITGVWYGPGVFFAGIVVETIGYVVVDRSTPSKPKG